MAEVWSRGLLERVTACPGCGSAAVASEYRRRDDRGAMPDEWCMKRCARCRSLYLDPRPDVESLPHAYRDYYTHQPMDAPAVEAGGLRKAWINGYLNWRFRMGRRPAMRIGAIVLSAIPPLAKKLDVYGRHIPRAWCSRGGRRLLDVGCGNGDFLRRAMTMGFDVRGCDPDPAAVQGCRDRGLDVLCGDASSGELDAQRFDVVTLNHVIEHVHDPQALLARIHELLVPGGRVWLGLPNPRAMGLLIFGAGWKGLHPPFHLMIPDQRVLVGWLRAAGFVQVRLVRRGAQSAGLWKESRAIARRERVSPSWLLDRASRLVGDLLSTLSARWSEETIIVARTPE